jgi:DNA-binding YbaB/EbfC family protein
MKMDMKSLMKKAQELQSELAKRQAELAEKRFEATSGGGMVTAVVNGKHELIELKIDPDIISKDEVEMIQDLVVAAVNEGFKKAGDAMQDAVSGMMGGAGGMPNMFG